MALDPADLPDGVEAANAGLTPGALAELADRAAFEPHDLELLRAAGFRVLTDREAEAGLYPPWQLTLSARTIIYDERDGTHLAVGAGMWIKHTTLARDVVTLGLTGLDADTAVPFWLVLPQPMNPLGELPDEVIDSLQRLPTVAEPSRWALADADVVETAAKAAVALNPAALALPCVLMRGSLATELVHDPLRTLEEWRAHRLFGYVVHNELGGRDMWAEARVHRTGPMAEERRYNRTYFSGDGGWAFWEALELSERCWQPVAGDDGELDQRELATLVETLEEDGWFNLWGLDVDIDGFSLLNAPVRTRQGWYSSDFAHLVRKS